jgi:hypothetical protein
MDGTHSTSRKTTLLARRAASLALAACSLSFAAAPALAADPAGDFGPGTATVTSAEEIAKAFWQTTPCAGQVSLVWMNLNEGINATSTWTNPVGQYDAPEHNGACQIAFNRALTWDWTRFCSILVHEYGHLAGHAHADDHADVMFAFYEAPVAQCAAAPPVQLAATEPEPVLPAAKAATAASPRAVSSSRQTKRGVLVRVREHGKRRTLKHRRHKHHGRGSHRHGKHHRGHRKHRVGHLVRA